VHSTTVSTEPTTVSTEPTFSSSALAQLVHQCPREAVVLC
jgi:hypothetical protein